MGHGNRDTESVPGVVGGDAPAVALVGSGTESQGPTPGEVL